MTLTQYIGSYLYSPVQFWISRRRQDQGKKVSRKAQATLEGFTQMIAFPTIFTMFIAGVWHGAGLQFIVFGVLHGIYLTINHGWRNFRHRKEIKPIEGVWRLPVRAFSVLLVFGCVLLAQVFFRASSVHEAMLLLYRMAGIRLSGGAHLVNLPGVKLEVLKIIAGFVIVWAFPNTQQILARYKPALELAPADQEPRWLPIFWKPNLAWGLALGGVVLAALVQMQDPSTFLYFQF